MLHEPNLLSLIQVVCNDIQNINSHTNEDFKNHIILSTQNDIIDSINNDMIDIFPIVPWVFFNANIALFEVGASNHNLYPIGYLNFLNLPKLPPWKLHFKVGCPIMLCYNKTPKHGLCNGFQFIVTCLNHHVIEIHI